MARLLSYRTLGVCVCHFIEGVATKTNKSGNSSQHIFVSRLHKVYFQVHYIYCSYDSINICCNHKIFYPCLGGNTNTHTNGIFIVITLLTFGIVYFKLMHLPQQAYGLLCEHHVYTMHITCTPCTSHVHQWPCGSHTD